jgi:hypothetical protein
MSDDYDDLRRQVKAATPAEQVETLERLINLLLRHGVSFQQIQRALPRKEDGRPMSLAGEIIMLSFGGRHHAGRGTIRAASTIKRRVHKRSPKECLSFRPAGGLSPNRRLTDARGAHALAILFPCTSCEMAGIGGTFAASRTSSDLGVSAVDSAEKRRRARARADEIADKQNLFGSGQPDRGKRRPQRPQGNSRQALMRRLRRDHPQLHRLVLDGQISPYRAAVVAGFRRPPGPRPKRSTDSSDPGDAEVLLELWLGPNESRGSVFADADELRQAWLRHRDKVMALWGSNCRRPQAWWEFSDWEFPGYDAEPAFLFKHDLLSPEERIRYETQRESQKKSPAAAIAEGPEDCA